MRDQIVAWLWLGGCDVGSGSEVSLLLHSPALPAQAALFAASSIEF